MTDDSRNLETVSATDAAQRAGDTMFASDRFSHALEFNHERTEPGRARLSVVVREDMLNGHAICHGGLIFTLADTALAHASNSHNRISVAAGCSIDFLAPAKRGDRLTAEAVEQSLLGRTGVYDVRVVNQRDELVALFRGKVRALKGAIVEDIDIAGS